MSTPTSEPRPQFLVDHAFLADGSRPPTPGPAVVQPERSVRPAAYHRRGVGQHRRIAVPACPVQDRAARPYHRPGVRHPVHRQFRLPQDRAHRRVRQRAGAQLPDEGRHARRRRHPHPPLRLGSGGAVRLRPDPAAVQETDRARPRPPRAGKRHVRRDEPRTGARAGHDRHARRAVAPKRGWPASWSRWPTASPRWATRASCSTCA